MKEASRGSGPVAFGRSRTLTFLFADLRDYTRFVETQGDRAASVLIADYRRIVRSAATSRGAEIKTEGDSFYIVFEAAREAVECGIAILQETDQRTLERPDLPIHVGVGIHAGEPVPHEGQYVGSAVNLAARLGSAAGTGQLLVTDLIRGLLRTSGQFTMNERHDLVLKGIDDAPRIFEVEWRTLPRRTPEPASPGPAPSGGTPSDRRVLCPRLIGRDVELSELHARLGEIRDGATRTVLVAGEAGIGKTALLRAFAERTRGIGTRFLLGECTAVEARAPFGPFAEIVRSALSSGALPRRALQPELIGLLAQGEGEGEASVAEAFTESTRYRVDAAFLQAFTKLGRQGSVVIAIEDLHWADEASLELFPYLARKLRNTTVMLLGTYRTDELHRRHPLRKVLADLARGRLAVEVALRPLDLEEVGEIMRGALRLDGAPSEAFRALIHERCEGNPLFIEEVLRALVERDDLSYHEGTWRLGEKGVSEMVVPDSIRDAVLGRLDGLTSADRQILEHAAVIGRRFDLELLGRVTGVAEPQVIAAVRPAIDAQLLDVERDRAGGEGFVFRHALTRDAVVSELLQRERQVIHRAVAEAIEAMPDADARVEELAFHFDEGREPVRARRYRSEAARQAAQVFAYARAVQHLERAIALAPADDAELAELHLRLAEVSYFQNDFQRSLRAADLARRLFLESGSPFRAADVMHLLVLIRRALGDAAGMRSMSKEAVALLEPLGDSGQLAIAYGHLGRLAALENQPHEALTWSEKAADVARRTGDRIALLDALTNLGEAKVIHGERDGFDLLRESLRVAKTAGHVEHVIAALDNLMYALYRSGDFAEARAVFKEAEAFAREIGRWAPALLAWRTWYLLVDGEWDRVIRLHHESETETTLSATRALWVAIAITARDGPEVGLRVADEARRRMLAVGFEGYTGGTGVSTHSYFVAGELRAVLDQAEVVVVALERDVPHSPVSHGAMAAMAAARALGDTPALDRWIARSLISKSPLAGHQEARRILARALQLERAGDIAGTLQQLTRIGPFLVDASPVSWLIVSQVRVELLLRKGARADAQGELTSATAFWRKAGARWYVERLAEWARTRGLDPG